MHLALGDGAVQVQQRSSSGNKGLFAQAAKGAGFHRVTSRHLAYLYRFDESRNFYVCQRHIFIYSDEAVGCSQRRSQPVCRLDNLVAAEEHGIDLAGNIRLVVDSIDADGGDFLPGGLFNLIRQRLAVVFVDDIGAAGNVSQLLPAERTGQVAAVFKCRRLQGSGAVKRQKRLGNGRFLLLLQKDAVGGAGRQPMKK